MSSWLKQAVTVAAVATTVGTAVPAVAADFFIKIGDIKGESTDAKHKGEIDALSWSWGTSQTGRAPASGAAAAGKPMPQELVITKAIDVASPQLLQFATNGKHIAEVLLTVRVPGRGNIEYIKIKLKDVWVTSVKLSGVPAQDRPVEEIALSYQAIEYTVTPISGVGTPVTTTFNFATNKS